MNAYRRTAMLLMLFFPLLAMVGLESIQAQEVEVHSADPNFAEQGTLGLEVTIKGSGFEKGAKVRFILFDNDLPGGIEVEGKVKIRGSKTIIATINVSESAVVDDYNIEVTLRSGRNGKGTTRLFSVKAKSNTPGHGSLVAKFALEITSPSSGPGLRSDSDGIYFDSNKEKVLVFTGQGPGFRFDTNKSSTGKSTAVRFVDIHFPGGFEAIDLDGIPHSYDSGDYEIDFRFDLSSGALELGDLEVGVPAEVPIGIKIQSADKTQAAALGYGDAPKLFSNPALDPACMLENTRNAVVIRIADDAWTIESDPANPNACLWFGLEVFEGLPSQPLEMPFHFTIVIDE